MAAPTRDTLSRISGPESMAKPSSGQGDGPSSSLAPDQNGGVAKGKKKKRGGQKHRRKTRRQSFIAPSESATEVEGRPSMLDAPNRSSAQHAGFYRVQGGNRSNTSLESEALLDHREHTPMKSRRQSLQQGFTRPSLPFARHRASQSGAAGASAQKSRLSHAAPAAISEDEDEQDANDRTPLLGTASKPRPKPEMSRHNSGINYGSHGSNYRTRRASAGSKASSKRRNIASRGRDAASNDSDDYDVNNPPSVPGSPKVGSLDDVMVAELSNSHSDRGRDAVIDIDSEEDDRYPSASPDSRRRRPTLAQLAERDVCFPSDVGMSEMGDEEDRQSPHGSVRPRRRRTRHWPDLEILEDWSREEKEERTQQEHIRAKKISEPVMVGGRLRPAKTVWHREEDDAPFRFTYFNELFDATIHARTISDLLQDGASFRDLFFPDPAELSESSEDEGDDAAESILQQPGMQPAHMPSNDQNKGSSGPSSDKETGHDRVRSPPADKSADNSYTASGRNSEAPTPRPYQGRRKRYGPRPTFWLDILQPTEEEMKVIAKAFGIHQLTTEDILMQEPREKVELFSNYYFVNYRSFEQDSNSEDYMEPVNMSIIVFRDGVLTFHQSMTPHPANVRRRVRQLNDYMSPTADWISYAIIDDVTDVFAPLVHQIESEVDQIDDDILYLHQSSVEQAMPEDEKSRDPPSNQGDMGAQKADGEKTAGPSGGDMLRRVGECRKKVMGLYRLLGNKADVIKGFAKRCNEHWEVAPRSEIGLYLGDIQDHIVTMTSNLSHYENLLSRAHSNYLAQINIRMNERAEQTADVLGKLTVLGTIVLPMNIITGMWGMNVWVPGQDLEHNLVWFWCITAGLFGFGLSCYFVAKKVYGIV